MPSEVYVDGLEVPVYVGLATFCEHAPHPFESSSHIGFGQKKLDSRDNVLPGTDTGHIGINQDGCPFSASAAELAPQRLLPGTTAGPFERLQTFRAP